MEQMNATLEYTRNAVLTASRAKLVVMMYDGAIRFVEQARFHLGRGNAAACGTAISHAYNVVSELKVALDFESGGETGKELATNLANLYDFVMHRLVKANVNRSEKELGESLMVLGTLRQGWVGLLQKA